MIGEFLYQLTAKDAITQPVIQRRFNRARVSAAATVVNVDLLPVPGEYVEVVTHINISCAAGAAQTLTRALCVVRDPQGNDIFNVFLAQSGIQFDDRGMKVELVLFPGELLRVTGVFNAGANANAVIGNAHGYILPKGSLQLR
jgi:hypothetical protein